jgi:hypothetical protein
MTAPTLYLDVRDGATAARIRDALLACGAAAPAVERAVAALDLPNEPLLWSPADVPPLLRRASLGERAQALSADALGRLFIRESQGWSERFVALRLEAQALRDVVGATVAVESLAPDEVVSSYVDERASTSDGVALVEALTQMDGRDEEEPRWARVLARGASGGVRAVLGERAPE